MIIRSYKSDDRPLYESPVAADHRPGRFKVIADNRPQLSGSPVAADHRPGRPKVIADDDPQLSGSPVEPTHYSKEMNSPEFLEGFQRCRIEDKPLTVWIRAAILDSWRRVSDARDRLMLAADG